MNMFTPSDTPINRRQVFKIGGLTVSVAALVAACGSDVNGDTAPGRVGYAPAVTDPPEYVVDDAVLLRTASSLEYTAIEVYGAAAELASLDAATQTLVAQLIDNHQAIADEMGALTEAEGGVAWECTNPWLDNRLIAPLVEAIKASDNPARDVLNFAVAFENLAASTHQVFAVQLTDDAAKSATLSAAMLASRHSAAIVVLTRGADGYISPALYGDGVPTDPDGVPYNYAVTDRFGSVGQAELVVGAADVNGKRTSFLLQTPAENSFVYNELEPSC
jgi:predicted FMN-binding regulatory protein PaiB